MELPFIKKTMALGASPNMDVVSEHSYGQIELPEINLPKQTKAAARILAATRRQADLAHGARCRRR